MAHLILFGTLISNHLLVSADDDAVHYIKEMLNDDWYISHHDDAALMNLPTQSDFSQLKEQTAHLLIGLESTQLLSKIYQLHEQYEDVSDFVWRTAQVQVEFNQYYQNLLAQLTQTELKIIVCTIYDQLPPSSDLIDMVAKPILSFANDVIIRQASQYGLPILDLRRVCSDKDDYKIVGREIHPTQKGGRKIANALVQLIKRHDFDSDLTMIYPPSK